MIDKTLISLDQDWAPNFVVKYVSDLLSKYNLRATWFITNDFPFLDEMKKNKLFELGIHPNFESNSTQGNEPNVILDNLKKILPHAKTVRTHSLFQSSRLLQKFQNFGLENDSSILLTKTPGILPHFSKVSNLFRFPFFWEDDEELYDIPNWEYDHPEYHVTGLKIFNFHPIHIFLNSDTLETYSRMKEKINFSKLDQNSIQDFINKKNPGIGTFFQKMISNLQNQQTYTISELKKIK